MKVILTAVNSKFIHSNLAIRYLKAYTKDLQYDCVLKEFSINDRIERIVQEIIYERPDMVAFSCYIWNIEYVEKISNLIKLINKDIIIVFGGPEVSYDGKSYLKNKDCDYVIEGEGEECFRELIEYKINYNKSKIYNIKDIKGIYYLDDDRISYNGKRNLMDMNKLIFPYSEDENLDNKIVYYEASRGCPFNCKYCLSSTIHGVRFLDINRVKKELKFFIDKKVRLVKFVDRTFNCNVNFAMDVWKFLIEQDTETTFHFEISADILTEEEIKILSRAPKERFQFEVGVQTTNNEILRNINRTANFKDIKEKVEELMGIKNIKQHLDLIAGLPGESYSSFKNSFNDLYTIHSEEIQLGFLKLLKGSKMREEKEKWGMVHSPYPPYEILKTKDISYEELLKLKRVEEMVDKYYNSGKFSTILKYFIDKFETPYDFYHALGEFFYFKGYFSRNISSVDYYKVFLEFNKEIIKEEQEVLKEIIKFDYLRFNKKKWLPEFLYREEDKNMERKIKEDLINKGIINKYKSINSYHIEKFKVDICKFIEDNNIEKGEIFILFYEKDKSWLKI
ncbi:anaerobic magnesium-protoporphyrin IX monomethyl ester cyclase [Clostridium tetanomorphum]|uniref:B12-binding domain-containing radical SAM protein n=1 Tax=Clostridium tetanomorphum TaxID=1553 RepID=A0A923E773_CLOTT|nr:B12-binding domain-containing radical SAM protein [Clostridium tetanomorphum]MBC2396502.1 B12-binding domain-containing radical SAM protein [Clostridium tetanomorphum]MBP1863826.1 anaerobic magnesium-protoporphyrin IX monomethyl ester cyclase [Clostridium tetanomorphum]NRS84904.1 anaerobic magnesium-protoporphyrin IX monomethyl ester cyclase [Clostridium tetanomorphum]NRZ98120.1 anaerobic magnesium-protoporphyrin IX monomethyl ester cyclase [Clostridium tetanomorphum]SQB91579.1 magnesium-pr